MSAAVETLEPKRQVLATFGNGSRNRKDYVTLEDGSIVLSPEDLAVLGFGDAKRGAKEIRRMIAMERERKTIEGNTPRPSTVRVAGPEDEEAVLALLMEEIRENGAMVALPDKDRMLFQIRLATEQKGSVLAVIDGPEGKPVAVTLLASLPWWWSRNYFMQEVSLFVHPEHRASKHFDDLMQFQRWWVEHMTESLGYQVYLLCGVVGTRDVVRKALAYRRRYRRAGWVFLYPAPPFNEVTT